jgi:hypothetical protein
LWIHRNITPQLAQVEQCAVKRRASSAGEIPARQGVAPAGSSRSGDGGNEIVGAFDGTGRRRRLSEHAGRNACEHRAGLEKGNAEADPPVQWGRPPSRDLEPRPGQNRVQRPWVFRFRRGSGDGMHGHGDGTQHGKPEAVKARDLQPDAREGQAGPHRVAERPVVARRPGNAGGAKGPWFKVSAERGEDHGDWR